MAPTEPSKESAFWGHLAHLLLDPKYRVEMWKIKIYMKETQLTIFSKIILLLRRIALWRCIWLPNERRGRRGPLTIFDKFESYCWILEMPWLFSVDKIRWMIFWLRKLIWFKIILGLAIFPFLLISVFSLIVYVIRIFDRIVCRDALFPYYDQ